MRHLTMLYCHLRVALHCHLLPLGLFLHQRLTVAPQGVLEMQQVLGLPAVNKTSGVWRGQWVSQVAAMQCPRGQASMHDLRARRITTHASQLTCSMSAMDCCRMTGFADTPVPPLRARSGFSGTCLERASCMAATLFTLPACRWARRLMGPTQKAEQHTQTLRPGIPCVQSEENKNAAQKAEGHAAGVPPCT